MQCKKCGTEIKDGYLFCPNCAEEVQIVPDYDPEFDDIVLNPLEEKGTSEKLQEEAEPVKVENQKDEVPKKKKNIWIPIVGCLVILLGITAFFVTYRMVLENQEPDAMIENELPKETSAPRWVPKPVVNLPGGEYSYYVTIRLTSEVPGDIHYTLDGSIPDETSKIYDNPLELSEGITVLRAFVVDEDGNCGKEIIEVYTIEFGAPDAPVIFPGSGNYEGEHYIRIIVPDRCLAYYTLDGTEPNHSSEIYTGEFLMPAGETTVRVILEDENGNTSDITTVIYNCVPIEMY